MSDKKKTNDTSRVDRRELLRKGAKAAYVVPAVLAAVKATERPAYAEGSGVPPISEAAPAAPPVFEP